MYKEMQERGPVCGVREAAQCGKQEREIEVCGVFVPCPWCTAKRKEKNLEVLERVLMQCVRGIERTYT